MNNAISTQFAELIDSVTSYMVLVGLFYTCVFIFGVFFITCWKSLDPYPRMTAYFRRIGRLALFLLVLLLVGDFFSMIWGAMVHNHIYHNPGYSGLDFVPWYPVTRGLVGANYGFDSARLIGVTLFQLQVIWFVFAAATWSTTMLVFERITSQQVPARRRVGMRA